MRFPDPSLEGLRGPPALCFFTFQFSINPFGTVGSSAVKRELVSSPTVVNCRLEKNRALDPAPPV